MRYGWRGRIGHIAPAILDTSAEEIRKLLPDGVLHVGLTITRPIQHMREESLDVEDLMIEAAKRLGEEEVDVVICGGGPVGAHLGVQREVELAEAIARASGRPAVMANQAVTRALAAMDLRRVILISPFTAQRNVEIAAYFQRAGFEIAGAEGLGLEKNVDFARQSATTVYVLARSACRMHPDADGIYIACPRWPVVDIVSTLERDTGKTVVAGAAAMAWAALSELGVRDAPSGRGRLMDSLRS